MYTVYKGYDNTFTVQLLEDEEPQDLGAATKVELIYKGESYDSDTYSDSFDFVTGAATGLVIMKLGIISTIPLGTDSRSELIVYDAVNTNGIFWGKLVIKVVLIT